MNMNFPIRMCISLRRLQPWVIFEDSWTMSFKLKQHTFKLLLMSLFMSLCFRTIDWLWAKRIFSRTRKNLVLQCKIKWLIHTNNKLQVTEGFQEVNQDEECGNLFVYKFKLYLPFQLKLQRSTMVKSSWMLQEVLSFQNASLSFRWNQWVILGRTWS